MKITYNYLSLQIIFSEIVIALNNPSDNRQNFLDFFIFTKSTNMKTLKIYSIITTLSIIVLFIWMYSLKKDLKETEGVLQQCTKRYYEKIGKPE